MIMCNSCNFPAAKAFENVSRKENKNILNELKNYIY